MCNKKFINKLIKVLFGEKHGMVDSSFSTPKFTAVRIEGNVCLKADEVAKYLEYSSTQEFVKEINCKGVIFYEVKGQVQQHGNVILLEEPRYVRTTNIDYSHCAVSVEIIDCLRQRGVSENKVLNLEKVFFKI